MKVVWLGFLASVCLVSALMVVVARHETRTLFIELQQHEKQRDEMQVEWGQLQLELGTWATHGRIEKLARSELGMRLPGLDEAPGARP